MNDYCEDDEPVHIALYLDHRDAAADNYPEIALCDECAEYLGGEVGELTELEAGKEAACERCGRENAAAMLSNRYGIGESTR